MTLHDKLIATAEAIGLVKTANARTAKYDVYDRPKGGFYYIGRHGCLRYGRTVRDSFALNAKDWIDKNAPDALKAQFTNGRKAQTDEEYI